MDAKRLILASMKQRSPRFPFIPLQEAVQLLPKLHAIVTDPAKPLTRDAILKALDYESLHGAAIKTIGALRAYDLLEKTSDGLHISQLGRSLLASDDGDSRTAFLQRAALSPLTFRMLWRRARHSSRPELKDLLIERGFTEPGARRASRIYRLNDELASLGDLELEPELPERGKGRKVKTELKNNPQCAPKPNPGRPRINPNSLSIPLSTGAAIIPKGITAEEFTNLMQTLRTWKGQLVRKVKATDDA